MSHPHYPSLKSVTDTLRRFSIEHYALNLEYKEIKEIGIPFIAHLKISGGQLAFIDKIENGLITYSIQPGKPLVKSYHEFEEFFSGAVIVLQPNDKIVEDNYKQNKQNELLSRGLLPLSGLSIFF